MPLFSTLSEDIQQILAVKQEYFYLFDAETLRSSGVASDDLQEKFAEAKAKLDSLKASFNSRLQGNSSPLSSEIRVALHVLEKVIRDLTDQLQCYLVAVELVEFIAGGLNA